MNTKTALLFSAALSIFSLPVSSYAAEDLDKVFGSLTVDAGQSVGNVSLVNGAITLEQNSRAKAVDTVNGSIDLYSGVQLNSATTVNGSIEVAESVTVSGDVTTVNGSVSVDRQSQIGGNIETVNGDISVTDTTVSRDLITVNGDITLSGDTQVHGDIVFKKRGKKWSFFGFNSDDGKPTLTIGRNVQVQGEIVLQQDVILKLENPALAAKVAKRFSDNR